MVRIDTGSLLGEARKRDLLPPAPKGRAGEWLTEKAYEMLNLSHPFVTMMFEVGTLSLSVD